ncbi:MAG: radical SAM protein [Nitrosomonadales bacterium]|nr:MAG: radical SAM protein [Nitrosomonadales bacterium]
MQGSSKLLNVTDHSRDNVGLTYIYPVVSRRAGGVSIGINLNPNSACNWRCIYCQVPELKRGAAPTIDLIKLEKELYVFLQEILYGSFMQEQITPSARRIIDIALSGNGEPTSAKEFEQVIDIIGKVKHDFDSLKELKVVLITNGSLIDRSNVKAGLRSLAELKGEIWFKLDSVTREGRQQINNTRMSSRQVHNNLKLSTSLCQTWIQTCVFKTDGDHPTQVETKAYLKFIEELLQEGALLKGVLLYGLARSSMQPEAPRLTKVTQGWIESFGRKIHSLGLPVKINM